MNNGRMTKFIKDTNNNCVGKNMNKQPISHTFKLDPVQCENKEAERRVQN